VEQALRREAAERSPSALAVATEGGRSESHAGMQIYISHPGVRQW
jgi:hypothetical protein